MRVLFSVLFLAVVALASNTNASSIAVEEKAADTNEAEMRQFLSDSRSAPAPNQAILNSTTAVQASFNAGYQACVQETKPVHPTSHARSKCNMAKCNDPACPRPLNCKPPKNSKKFRLPEGTSVLSALSSTSPPNRARFLVVKDWDANMRVIKAHWTRWKSLMSYKGITKCYPYVPEELRQGAKSTVVCSKLTIIPLDHSEFLHDDPGCLDWSNKYAEARWSLKEANLFQGKSKKSMKQKARYKKINRKYKKRMKAAAKEYGVAFSESYCNAHPKRHPG